MMRRLIGRIHLWVALVLCAPLVVLGLTGSILVFEDELRAAFASAAAARPGETHPLGDIIAAARAAAPAGFVLVEATPRRPAPGGLVTIRLVAGRPSGGS